MIVLCIIQFLIGLSLVRPISVDCRIDFITTRAKTNKPDRRRFPSSMGLLPRRRPPLLDILPPRQQAHPIPARPHGLRPRRRMSNPRPTMLDQQCRSQRTLLPLCCEQLPIMGHPDFLPHSLGSRPVCTRRILYRPAKQANRLHRRRLPCLRRRIVYVSNYGARSSSYVPASLT